MTGKQEKEKHEKYLRYRIDEMKQHLDLNCDTDDGEGHTDDDAIDHLMDECGKDRDGYCSQAGTEYCDFECPFSN